MSRISSLSRIIAITTTLAIPFAFAETLPPVEVTTSKLAEPVDRTPAMISVVSGDDLRARGAYDLRTALSLVAGVDIAPGGDAGPAGSVPGLWGLREFDAFLLVVDGVPAGGAFNPALTTLDLNNVARIEVLRGAAPVMYGATSFVGVIHVIHYEPGETPGQASATLGTHSTGKIAVSSNLPEWGAFKQSISANAETNQFSQDRSDVQRAHVLYRNQAELEFGKIRMDVDAVALRQSPYSPHPREGSALSPRFPLDANINPLDARQDQNSLQFILGMDKTLTFGQWTTTLSVTRDDEKNTRGFLREEFADDGVTPNADGFRQNVKRTNVYFDSFIATHIADNLSWTFGIDWLYGNGKQNSANFEYAVLPNGANAPGSYLLPIDEFTQLSDKRNFAGIYTQWDWHPTERWDINAGLRFNHTAEERTAAMRAQHDDTPESSDWRSERSNTRLSGLIGTSYTLWQEETNKFVAFADYRNTYKPAAIDFGPEVEGGILQPETAHSWEAGLKGRSFDGQLEWEASYFDMDFNNLVIAENVEGLPSLANAGKERFKGAELEASYRCGEDWRVAATYAYHDARFTDYTRIRGDGSLQQLSGKRLELSPQNLTAIGLVYAPKEGLIGSITANYLGNRFLNKGNTSIADAYTLVDAGIGYRFNSWEVRLDGKNLTNRRDPVAESELGDAQFYRLPGRTVLLSTKLNF